MSVKRAPRAQAAGHATSLADAELEVRLSLASPTTRRKQKVIDDPTLGGDLTAKILKSAVEQREEREDAPLVPSLRFMHPDDPDDDLGDGAVDLETDLEVVDDESRQFFELFAPAAASASRQLDRALEAAPPDLDAAIRAVYVQLGTVLRLYKSGKLPKAVHAVACQGVPAWLALLQLAEPARWSANAVLAVTTLFVQTASDGRCQTYLHEVLLPCVRQLLEGARRLPQQIFQALVLAARRPRCFVLGVLLPLSQEPTCTLKEAKMIATIAGKVRVSKDHANAFLIKVCEAGEVTPVRTIFVAKFIGKGQALAVQAIDAILSYFMRFLAIDGKQPLLWHRALVDFVKRYGRDLTQEQRAAVAELVAKHSHHHVTPEVFTVFKQVPPREEGEPAEPIPTF
jgi:essential nuclear protein 1